MRGSVRGVPGDRHSYRDYATSIVRNAFKASTKKTEIGMDPITLGLGVLLLGFGIYTLYSKVKTPHKLGKLQAMRDKFGNGAGTLIHTITYSLIPVVAGTIFIWSGYKGISITQIVGG